jgi:hypothetical protein
MSLVYWVFRLQRCIVAEFAVPKRRRLISKEGRRLHQQADKKNFFYNKNFLDKAMWVKLRNYFWTK